VHATLQLRNRLRNGTPVADEDNYVCEDGGCRPTGCNSDAECDSQIAGNVCRLHPIFGLPNCDPGCITVVDCSTDSILYDADNYECEGGVCRHLGCNNDAECEVAFGTRPSACVDIGFGLPMCVLTCQTPADCSLGIDYADTDNYRCEDNLCIPLGCLSDGECSPRRLRLPALTRNAAGRYHNAGFKSPIMNAGRRRAGYRSARGFHGRAARAGCRRRELAARRRSKSRRRLPGEPQDAGAEKRAARQR
jgi:hypothetical protein